MFIFWRGGGGGMGWGNNVLCDFNYGVRFLVLPHICHATLLDVLFHFHTYVMLRCWTFPCTSTPALCCAAGRSLALPHIRHALLLDVLSCYAAGRSLALPHLRYAALPDVLLHFHTYVMLCCWTFSHATLLDILLQKKELFHEARGTQKYRLVVVKH